MTTKELNVVLYMSVRIYEILARACGGARMQLRTSGGAGNRDGCGSRCARPDLVLAIGRGAWAVNVNIRFVLRIVAI